MSQGMAVTRVARGIVSCYMFQRGQGLKAEEGMV